jgi:hypothetical protein
VSSRQVVDSSLLRRDFHAGVLAITGRPLVKVATAFPPPGAGETDAMIPCPEGSYATGGGFLADFSADRDLVVLGSTPTTLESDAPGNSHPNGWMLRLVNHGTTRRPVKYYVVCVRGGRQETRLNSSRSGDIRSRWPRRRSVVRIRALT